MIPADNYTDYFATQATSFDVYTPIKSYAGAAVQPDVIKPFIVPDKPQVVFSNKITISTTVYDEFGDPLPGANIWIDGKGIASTYNNGTVTVPGIATSTSIIKISFMGMKDYNISAVFLPKKVMMQRDITALDEVIVTPKKKPIAIIATPKPTPEPSKTNWLLWLTIAGLGFKVYQRFGPKSTTVKAKI